MVFTFVLNLRGVGLASFTLDGEALQVPRGNGLFTGDPVAVDDYVNLLVSTDIAVPPGPTTTVPPETTIVPDGTTTTTTVG